MRLLIVGLVVAASLALTSMNLAADPVQSLYELKVNSLDGKPVDLGQYKGHVVLVVNVASKCGFTPQYAGLEKLYLHYKEKGFVILGFPSNDFGHQEPGTPQEIAAFCTGKYNVTFPMFEKVEVARPESPLWSRVPAATLAAKLAIPDWLVTVLSAGGEVPTP